MGARYRIFAMAIVACVVVCVALAIVYLVPTPTGVSVTFLGYGEESNAIGKLLFVVTNGSSKPISISSDPIEFRNAQGWLFLGPQVDFSTTQVMVVQRNISPGESFQFYVTQPTEKLPWRASLNWFTPYDRQWWKVQRFIDAGFRRMKAAPPFTRSGILKGPEFPFMPPTAGTNESRRHQPLHLTK